MTDEDVESVIGDFYRWVLHNLGLDSDLTVKADEKWTLTITGKGQGTTTFELVAHGTTLADAVAEMRKRADELRQ
jgi:hypothetical protein